MDDRGAMLIPRCQSSMLEIKFSQKAAMRALSSLDIHKSSGPHGISPLVLSSCAPELSPVLTRLFRHSYSIGVVPDLRMSALIHSILKKGDGSDPSNYKLIAITSLLSKVIGRATVNMGFADHANL